MIIKKIRWNGRVQDVTHLGDKTGTQFVCESAEVGEIYSGDRNNEVTLIKEITPTVYDIHYRNRVLRVINPIEVWMYKSETKPIHKFV